MDWLRDIFGTTGKIIKETNSLIDNSSTSDEEKLEIKQGISSIIFQAFGKVEELKAKIILSDTEGNSLQRSVRPIITFSFLLLLVYLIVFPNPNLIKNLKEVPTELWGLFEIVIGGYFITRGIQKTADKITKNLDLSFLRKRDRKEHYEQ